MSKQKIQITIPQRLVAELERLSKEKGMTKSVLITLALDEYLEEGESNEGK